MPFILLFLISAATTQSREAEKKTCTIVHSISGSGIIGSIHSTPRTKAGCEADCNKGKRRTKSDETACAWDNNEFFRDGMAGMQDVAIRAKCQIRWSDGYSVREWDEVPQRCQDKCSRAATLRSSGPVSCKWGERQ